MSRTRMLQRSAITLFTFFLFSFHSSAQEDLMDKALEHYTIMEALGMKEVKLTSNDGVKFVYKDNVYYMAFSKNNRNLYSIGWDTKLKMNSSDASQSIKQYKAMEKVSEEIHYVKSYESSGAISIDVEFLCKNKEEFKKEVFFYLDQIGKGNELLNKSLRD